MSALLHSEQRNIWANLSRKQVDQRFALICDEMPQTIRLRISEVVDEEQPFDDSNIYQYVRMGDQIFQVPNLNEIQNQLSHKTF